MGQELSNLKQNINEAIEYIRTKTSIVPDFALILGTGLGKINNQMNIEYEIPYEEIPHFASSTVEFHAGKLVFASLSDKKVVIMQGRMHLYEGYSMQQITFPTRVMKYLGAEKIIITNACGSVSPYIRLSSIMIIDDHINLLGTNPLIGPNDETIGPRFPDMSRAYSPELIELCEKVAIENNIKVCKGVYAAMTGPTLETRAEYRYLRLIGADVVGMSTVPEVIVANHMGMKVLGLSVITDEGYPECLKPIDIQFILDAAAKAEPALSELIIKVIKEG